MTILVITLFFTLVGAFVIRACAPLAKVQGRLVARDRWAQITGFVTAITAFAIVSLPLEEVVVPAPVWLVGGGLLTGGGVGAVLCWPDLSWYAGANPLRRAIGVITTLCICALLIGVAVI